jgi:hypothetical protein
MTATTTHHQNPPTGQPMFEQVIRNNFTPEGVAMIIAVLRTAPAYRPAGDEARGALREVHWLAETLTRLLGPREYARLIEELGL